MLRTRYAALRLDMRGSREMGSDGSAAGGGNSDLSEWQRSADEEGLCAEVYAGHRNRDLYHIEW